MENQMRTEWELVNITNANENDLVKAAQEGNREAFNQLVLTYQDRIYNLALHISGDEDLAEDIAQNTFLKSFLNLPRFGHGSFRHWLYRIALNGCFDEIRHRKNHPTSSLEDEEFTIENPMTVNSTWTATLLPEVQCEISELRQAIMHALNQLDPNLLAVAVFVDMQDFSYQETAQILRIPIGTVKSRLARARMQLRRMLAGILLDKE